jgi:hypothetical protein
LTLSTWRPITSSNAFFPYKIGYSGTGVEPHSYFESIRKSIRPRDGYLEIGLGLKESANLQIFHPSAASNTFSPTFAKEISATQAHKVTSSLTVPLESLKEIISEYVSKSDLPFMLDIEGVDYEDISSCYSPSGFRPIDHSDRRQTTYGRVPRFEFNKNLLEFSTL